MKIACLVSVLICLPLDLCSAEPEGQHDNNVVVTVALPLQPHIQGVIANQLYVGFPNADFQDGHCAGNLKPYQISLERISSKPILVDANGQSLIGPNSAVMKNSLRGPHAATTDAARRVNNGLRRPVNYTCTNSCLVLERFKDSNPLLLPAEFAAIDRAEMSNIIQWATESVDPHHPQNGWGIYAQPTIINYGGDRGSYLFYGANDGLFHGVVACAKGQSNMPNSAEVTEHWTFSAPEQFRALTAGYRSQVANNSDDPLAARAKNYGLFDGPVAVYVRYNSHGEIGNDRTGESSRVIIYLTSKSTGSIIYAMDVTEPMAPFLVWRGTDASAGFEGLGQTLSKPLIAKINWQDRPRPVLLMGLGSEFARGGSVGRPQGRGLVIVDAVTGELIWRLIGDRSLDDGTSATLIDPMMKFAVPSGLSAIDRNTDGMVDRLYFGDAGGQLWRIDMASGDRATWQTRRLLTLDQGQTFFTTPDVVTDPSGSYDGIILGTGDLAQLSDSSVSDYLILYRDRDPVSPSKMPLPLSLGDLYRLVNSAGQIRFDVVKAASDPSYKKGWYWPLEKGEKVATRALTDHYETTVATHIPCLNKGCKGPGESRVYQFNAFDLAGENTKNRGYRHIETSGVPLEPIKFKVLADVQVCHGADCPVEQKVITGILFGPSIVPVDGPPLGVRRRLWWRDDQDK